MYYGQVKQFSFAGLGRLDQKVNANSKLTQLAF